MAKGFLKRPCILDDVSKEYLEKYKGKSIISPEARCELRARAAIMELSIARIESRWSEVRRLNKLLGLQTSSAELEYVSAKFVNRWLKFAVQSKGKSALETLGNIIQAEIEETKLGEDPNRQKQQKRLQRRYSGWNAYVHMKIKTARDAGDDLFVKYGPDQMKLWNERAATWSTEWKAATAEERKVYQKAAQVATRRRELGLPPWRLRSPGEAHALETDAAVQRAIREAEVLAVEDGDGCRLIGCWFHSIFLPTSDRI
eukprot:8469947-Pyramimonas_sp.AAC.1